jgi:hypothetical protein
MLATALKRLGESRSSGLDDGNFAFHEKDEKVKGINRTWRLRSYVVLIRKSETSFLIGID